ncbi:GAF domain-containing protein [Sphingobacterium sp. HJSM2_6]|uniref:GAF domain-containing protein n=1 Tax=Sphingobacterium sp. HJSM2_6 TaxID=3366264 RepID=UPI003BE320E8
MAEDLNILKGTKEEQYKSLIPQIQALVQGETNRIANMANVCAALKEQFHFFWVGFYIVEGDELVLGPFQGPVACTRIGLGRGVCGAAWEKEASIIVPDVEAFPGHIACSSLSKSEIVIPVWEGNTCIGILDVDSDRLNDFDLVDLKNLEDIVKIFNKS